MRRRKFIAMLGGAATWPLAAQGQDRVRRVGVLVPLRATDAVFQQNFGAFIAAMKSAGWVEGRNLDIQIVSVLGSGKSFEAAAADLLARSPETILGITRRAVEALHRQTSAVPIVFVVFSADPVETGLVAAINQPGGNITGVTDIEPSLGGKWLQLLKRIAPDIARVGVVYNPKEGGISTPMLWAIKEAARLNAVDLVEVPIHDEAEIERAIAAFAGNLNGGLIFPPSIFMAEYRARVITAANSHRIPTVFTFRFFAADGGLAAYSPSQPDEFGQAADLVNRILRGDKPAKLPVQTPNKYKLVINITTAKALGIEVPPAMLSIADELIE